MKNNHSHPIGSKKRHVQPCFALGQTVFSKGHFRFLFFPARYGGRRQDRQKATRTLLLIGKKVVNRAENPDLCIVRVLQHNLL